MVISPTQKLGVHCPPPHNQAFGYINNNDMDMVNYYALETTPIIRTIATKACDMNCQILCHVVILLRCSFDQCRILFFFSTC